jgi:hypothetical protein
MLTTVGRRASTAILVSVLGLAWTPAQVLAQIVCIPGLTCPPPPSDTTPPTVSITSPANGATVSGTINVTASASDNQGVAGVQFFLDGAFGAEDDTAPYSVPWDTTRSSNGSHTITAVARDNAGNQTTSQPVTVTVNNAASPPPPSPTPTTGGRHFEESDSSVTLSSGWVNRNANDWLVWSGGTAVQSSIPGASATFTFTGTSVTWIGMRSVDSGQARVLMDGALVQTVELFARRDESQSRVFSVRGLPNGTHTMRIEVAGTKHPDSQGVMVVVDAFEVPAPVVSHMQDTDPDMSYSAGWTGGDVSKPWSGGSATMSSTAGAQATFPFTGTEISVIGYRGPEAGVARFAVDGVSQDVDLFDWGPHLQGSVFAITGLSNSNHTLTITVTGNKNPNATGTLVVVDAFDVTHPGTRFQDTDPSISYSANWIQGNLNRSWSEGSISETDVAGATATFTFSGTTVSWIGCRKLTIGIADVFVDGVFVREIDGFQPAPIEGYQDTIFKASGLAPGTHTLTIQVTGRKNPAANNGFVVIDAFDVEP